MKFFICGPETATSIYKGIGDCCASQVQFTVRPLVSDKMLQLQMYLLCRRISLQEVRCHYMTEFCTLVVLPSSQALKSQTPHILQHLQARHEPKHHHQKQYQNHYHQYQKSAKSFLENGGILTLPHKYRNSKSIKILTVTLKWTLTFSNVYRQRILKIIIIIIV